MSNPLPRINATSIYKKPKPKATVSRKAAIVAVLLALFTRK